MLAVLMGDITGEALSYLKTTTLMDKSTDEQIQWLIEFLKIHSDVQKMTRDELTLFMALLIYKISESRFMHD